MELAPAAAKLFAAAGATVVIADINKKGAEALANSIILGDRNIVSFKLMFLIFNCIIELPRKEVRKNS